LKKIKLPKSFHHYLELWMYHSPLSRYEPEYMGHKAQNTLLLSSKNGSHRHCLSVLQAVTRVYKTPNSALFSST